MREIVDKVTCDICGKFKTTAYPYSGAVMSIPKTTIRTSVDVVLNDNDFFEIRPTKHLCGHCLNAVRAAAKPA